jgi:hypothetical protein
VYTRVRLGSNRPGAMVSKYNKNERESTQIALIRGESNETQQNKSSQLGKGRVDLMSSYGIDEVKLDVAKAMI